MAIQHNKSCSFRGRKVIYVNTSSKSGNIWTGVLITPGDFAENRSMTWILIGEVSIHVIFFSETHYYSQLEMKNVTTRY